jgi:Mlc titration factor MtfA (ptsG expression regulator)
MLLGRHLLSFSAIRGWRRERILRRSSLDQRLWRLRFARDLPQADQQRLHDLVVLFLHDKQFATAHGLQLTAGMQVWVAAQACILILELGLDYYRGWSGIILYPEQFVPRHQHTDELGVVHQGDEPYAGEAWLGGPVVLSWADAQGGDYADGVNVVIHEFAHKLDMLNGEANGSPPLHAGMSRQGWADAFRAAYQDFCARVDADEDTLIDPYAGESPGEFFAVLSEAFFETPDVVRDEYPEVYAQLVQFYRQDPARRLARRRRRTTAARG